MYAIRSYYGSVDGRLVEIVEIPEHPWFVACQFHPEFTSSPRAGHPLFTGFIEAALAHDRAQSGGQPGPIPAQAEPSEDTQVLKAVITSYSIHYTKLYEVGRWRSRSHRRGGR